MDFSVNIDLYERIISRNFLDIELQLNNISNTISYCKTKKVKKKKTINKVNNSLVESATKSDKISAVENAQE